MGGLCNYGENFILDLLFGDGSPATFYVGLSIADPTDDASGIIEPSGGAYARVAVTNNVTNWPAAVSGTKTNGTDIEFPQATGSWGTITHWFIGDAASGGNYYAHGAVDTSKTVVSGDNVFFSTGTLSISAD